MDQDWDVSSRGSQQRRLSLKIEGEDRPDDPEELIRGDARAVNCIRGVLIAVLVFATLLTAVANCALLERLETRTLSKDFDALATKLIQSFLDDLGSKTWQAYSISITMTGANMLNSTMPFFDELSHANQETSQSSAMVFSPLLYDDAAKIAWESFAQDILKKSKEDSTVINRMPPTINQERRAAVDRLGMLPPEKINFKLNKYVESVQSGNQCPSEGETHKSQISYGRPTHQAIRLTSNFTQIFDITDGAPIVSRVDRPYSPAFQVSSAAMSTANLYNLMSDPSRRKAIEAVVKSKIPAFTRTSPNRYGDFQQLFSTKASQGPIFSMFYPVFDDLSAARVTGTVSFDFSWTTLLNKILPVASEGIDLVLENTCGQTFTLSVAQGSKQLGFAREGDFHDSIFENMRQSSNYEDFKHMQLNSVRGHQGRAFDELDCKYRIHVYPSLTFLDRYKSSTPGIVTAVMVVTFLLTSIVFWTYDRLVRRLQSKVMRSAVRYNSFLSTLFPSTVRSRLFNNSHRLNKEETYDAFDRLSSTLSPPRSVSFLPRLMVTPKLQLKNYLKSTPGAEVSHQSLSEEPIADLFPHTTVFFADIAGFTAWSSEREPLNVFKLLETLYSAFDRIAARLGVFKVETVGDCYVAVTGLPEPQEDHAIIMAIFANECLSSMRELTKSLESILGPSTSSLALRVGMHSGPVIAGVLRGEKSRFQLFGDTMNTASRMESNGIINRIHVSQTTADLLRAAGKSDWIASREDHVFAKGKGTMQTYWVCPRGNPRPRVSLSYSGVENLQGEVRDSWGGVELDSSMCSLVDWNVDLLHKHLQKIVAHRVATTPWMWRKQQRAATAVKLFEDSHPRDEVVEALPMPIFSAAAITNPFDPAKVNLSESVEKQLRVFVARIAATYHASNAFHNFEHASHVAMSSTKLLNRILAPDGVDYSLRSLRKSSQIQAIAKEIHETTFGITSDPLLQFAAVFSALIHDVDHDGVPNVQLSREGSPVALRYNNQTVAEQHSVDVAWRILMEEQFQDLRSCIYETETEMLRFRQLVVNAVIATDIADESLQVWREARWNRAFHSTFFDPERPNRKASIVYAYILQASDVAHTMQHWHTYRKWNERLFAERYTAFQKGRCRKDPALTWYQDETSFFDDYVIPLAQKLEDCGVFGVSSHEYLSYAIENRDEWVAKGKEIVQDMSAKFDRRHRSRLRTPAA